MPRISLETYLWAALAILAISAAAYWLLRWLAFNVAARVASMAEDRLAGTVGAGLARARVRRAAPTPPDAETRRRSLAHMKRIAWLTDRIVPLPFGGGIGLDAIIGLVPVVGDIVALTISAGLILRAARMGAPPELLNRLIAIQCIDLALGAVPIVGDLVDIGYQANRRSVELIRTWLEAQPDATERGPTA